jgi:hypothetical protein
MRFLSLQSPITVGARAIGKIVLLGNETLAVIVVRKLTLDRAGRVRDRD